MNKRYIVESNEYAHLVLDTAVPDGEQSCVGGSFNRDEAEKVCEDLNSIVKVTYKQLFDSLEELDPTVHEIALDVVGGEELITVSGMCPLNGEAYDYQEIPLNTPSMEASEYYLRRNHAVRWDNRLWVRS